MAVLLAASFLAVAGGSAAAADPASLTGGSPVDQEILALLHRTEQQVTDGHTLSPPNDNALETWGLVLERASPPSPGARQALANFVADMRARAASDEAAGRAVVASDLTVFADQADDLLKQGHAGPLPSPTRVAVRESQAPDRPIRPVVRAEPLPAPAARHPVTAEEPASSMAEIFASRGDAMLAIKDISAARKFYTFAAAAGSSRAAMALGRTYDPNYAATLDIIGLKPDAKIAEEWYRKAAAMGDAQAKSQVGMASPDASK
jgi:hypothetical protein